MKDYFSNDYYVSCSTCTRKVLLSHTIENEVTKLRDCKKCGEKLPAKWEFVPDLVHTPKIVRPRGAPINIYGGGMVIGVCPLVVGEITKRVNEGW